jgi:hypothetical protein
MAKSNYDDRTVYFLKTRLWAEAYRFARDVSRKNIRVSGLELITALHIMIEETNHHWIEDKKIWNDILAESRQTEALKRE